jgi:hypothetical protein
MCSADISYLLESGTDLRFIQELAGQKSNFFEQDLLNLINLK